MLKIFDKHNLKFIFVFLGSKEEIAETILKFLMAPEGEPEQEQDEDDIEEDEEQEQQQSEGEDKKKRKRSHAQTANTKSTSGRPRRATAGRSNRG